MCRERIAARLPNDQVGITGQLILHHSVYRPPLLLNIPVHFTVNDDLMTF